MCIRDREYCHKYNPLGDFLGFPGITESEWKEQLRLQAKMKKGAIEMDCSKENKGAL